MKIYKGGEEFTIKVLTDAIKSLGMSDKQILAACRPRLTYYSNMTKSARRSCLWCPWSTKREHYSNGQYVPEPIQQLEEHYMKTHHGA